VLISRILRALTFDPELYEEVEHDKSAMWQAILILLLSSIATGLGTYKIGGVWGLVVATVLSFVGWLVMAFLIYLIGTKLFPESQTRTTVGELVRVLGFASAPGIFRVFAVIPYLSALVLLIIWVWIFVAMVVATRQALDFKNTWNAIWVCVVGLIAYGLVYVLLLFAYGLPKPIWS
jgi:hypothetical protein